MLYLIGVFFVIGGVDYILGSPLKLVKKFEEGIKTLGALGLSMIEIYSLAPILSNYLFTAIIPIYKIFNLDPSMQPLYLGGQFGFVSGIASKMLGAFIISKLTAGIISIVLAIWLYKYENRNVNIKGVEVTYEN